MAYMKDSRGRRLDDFRVPDEARLRSTFGPLASNRPVGPTGMQTGKVITAKFARLLPNGAAGMRLVYTNTIKNGTGEDPNYAGIHVKAAVEYPSGSIVPVTFGGRQVATIDPGGMVISDPVEVLVAPGGTFYERVSACPPMPPIVTATASDTGGALAAATYYYTVTSVTAAGESNASAEVTGVVTTGTTGSVLLTIGDANMAGADVLRWKIYRATTTGQGRLVASVPGSVRQYVDTTVTATPATTLTAGASSARTITVASTAGLKAGDTITVNTTDVVVNLVVSATSLHLRSTVTASNGATVTLKATPPSSTLGVPIGGTMSALDAAEGYTNSADYAYGLTTHSYTTGSNTQNVYVAHAVLAHPAQQATTIKPAIALLGDSIMNGTGWARTTAPYRGFAAHALADAYPFANVSTGGESAYQLAATPTSNVRFAVVEAAKYSISNYGTNDLNRTLQQIKDALLTIAQRAVAAGVEKHYQCTLVPKGSSTDGWRTIANQTPGANETNRQDINTWLRAPASAGAGNSFAADLGATVAAKVAVFDVARTVEYNADGTQITINATTGAISNGAGGRWKVWAGDLATKSGTTSGTTTTLVDSGKSWTVNEWAGYMLEVTTGGTQYAQIASNTATTLTLASSITSPTGSTTYAIYQGPTIDGTHPTDHGHIEMATAIDTSLFA